MLYCYWWLGYAGSDDNMQVNEVLGFVFDAAKIISNVGINGAKHEDMPDGTKSLDMD